MVLITDKNSFSAIGGLIANDGWKLYQEHLETTAQGCLSLALNSNTDDKARIRELDKYNTLKKMIQDVYAEYKINYDKYKGVE